MRTFVLILATSLCGCVFIENMTQRRALPDTRIPLDRNQVLRDVPRRDMDRYRCRDGTPIVAESVTGATFDLRCDGMIRL